MTNDGLRLLGRVKREGPSGLARRLVRRAYSRLNADELDFPLLEGDIADSTSVRLARAPRIARTRPLRVGWVTTPPSAGSGGHTTMFRMISAFERAGHECVVLLYDRHGGAHNAHVDVIARTWPSVRAVVVDVHDGFGGLDASVATSWQTAHVMALQEATVHPFYFIQDFEPFFYPHGFEYELAADTYRFGFSNIALGAMVERRLRAELGVDAAMVPFSCDTGVYQLRNTGPRSGVVCYAKPGVARRGYSLASRALARFHGMFPDQPIHLYGGDGAHIDVPVIRHGQLSPQQLNELYNQCVAGLAISFTNISLVAEEMLAAGVIPLVNASADAEADLNHPAVAWVRPTPEAVAETLGRIVQSGGNRAGEAAASVRADCWERAGTELVRIVEDSVYFRDSRGVTEAIA